LITLAISSRVVTALVVAGGIAVFGLLLVITAAGELRGRRKAKVPVGMRPAPSDEELEKTTLVRTIYWGAAATLVMALWLPAYWLREPTRLGEEERNFENLSLQHGEELWTEFQCNSCHGDEAEGGVRTFTVDGVDHQYAEPPLKYVYSRYIAAGRNEDEITQLITDAINRGRPGTPMPTWGLAFGGPLNSEQVDSLVDWIRSIQEEFPESGSRDGADLFEANCAICHGAEGEGGIGPNLQVAFDRLTRDQVAQTIRVGRLNTNRPSMPAWAALGDNAIEALVRFIESIQRSA
jgi:mono/diheme cytochrome c family protein